jgi:hypothetical protein
MLGSKSTSHSCKSTFLFIYNPQYIHYYYNNIDVVIARLTKGITYRCLWPVQLILCYKSDKSKTLNKANNSIIMKTKITPERNPTDNSIILSPPEPKYSIIWLHGLGDSS